MCLTEPQAGTDLGLLTTRAEPAGDGTYRVSGTKIFITAGDHDLTDQIVHLVLARLPDAPAGHRRDLALDRAQAACRHRRQRGRAKRRHLRLDRAQDGDPRHRRPACCTSTTPRRAGGRAAHRHGADVHDDEPRPAGSRRTGRRHRRDRLPVSARLCPRTASRAGAPAGASRRRPDPIIVHPDVRRTLLRMRALTEAGQSTGDVAGTRDGRLPPPSRRRPPSAGGRPGGAAHPVVKAACTDNGAEAASLGIGVLRRPRLHHRVRASSSSPATRASARSTRAPTAFRHSTWSAASCHSTRAGWLRRFFHLADGRLGAEHPAEVAGVRGRAGRSGVRAPAGHHHLAGGTRAGDREQAAAAATDYLRLFSLTAFGACGCGWPRPASGPRARGGVHPQKLATARFFCDRILPETAALAQAVRAGKASITAIGDDAF